MPKEPHRERVLKALRHSIATGEFAPGAKLPTTAELALQFGVGTTTVRQAILLMQATGELEGHQGVGVFVPEENLGT